MVVEPTPLKNMSLSVGMMNFRIYGKIKNVPNHQPERDDCFQRKSETSWGRLCRWRVISCLVQQSFKMLQVDLAFMAWGRRKPRSYEWFGSKAACMQKPWFYGLVIIKSQGTWCRIVRIVYCSCRKTYIIIGLTNFTCQALNAREKHSWMALARTIERYHPPESRWLSSRLW